MFVTASSEAKPFQVLLVCTGNICRSALAERLGRAYLAEVLGDGEGLIRLASAGTRAVVGSEMHADSALVLRGLGGDPGDFRARQLRAEHPGEADLILTMTREHRRAVLEMAPRLMSRTFTLLEAADLAAGLALSPPLAGGDLRGRASALVTALAAGRSHRRGSPADDVADPIGGPLEQHQAAGDVIEAALLPLLDRFAAVVATPAPPAEAVA